MKLGIMQPYYFPYLGHFALIAHCDHWVVFDVSQFTHKSWMTRNRILHPRVGWNYVSVPLANGSIAIRTSEARILSFSHLAQQLTGKLAHYRRRAPFWRDVERLIGEVFSQSTDSLVALNIRALAVVCRYLDIPFKPLVASTSLTRLPVVDYAGGWAPAICERLGASEYLNPIGGRAIFREADFADIGIALKFIDFKPIRYATEPWHFEENLSILDVMMWNSPSAIQQAIATNTRVIDLHNVEARPSDQNA